MTDWVQLLHPVLRFAAPRFAVSCTPCGFLHPVQDEVQQMHPA